MTGPDQRLDYRHLGRCLRAARGGRSRAEIEQQSGVSATQIKRYEAGQVTPPEPPDKMWMLATFYGWTPDSIPRVLAGGEPAHLNTGGPAPRPALAPAVLDKVISVVTNAETFTSAERREVLRWLLAHDG